MKLSRLQQEWDTLGREDSMTAIFSPPKFQKGAWASKEEEFWAEGVTEVDRVLARAAALAPKMRRDVALDFGCGIGRLTRPLALQFGEAVGVDIAQSMIEKAKATLPADVNCRFVVNARPDLSMFDNDSFDFVYSRIVLQHIPPDISGQYVAEFIRVVRPGGLALFQVPSHVTSIRSGIKRFVPHIVHAISKEMRARFSTGGKIRAYAIPRPVVEKTVAEAGGTLLAVDQDDSQPGYASFMYAATK